MSLPQPLEVNAEEKLAEFDAVPLFMKSLPDDAVDDPIISALQSLAHEGTPDEIAQNFKEQGNDYFKGKRYREALGFYSQGIEAKPTDKTLLEALLCNRAACNLELKNYGSVLKDCSEVIKLNLHSSKAYFRSATALVALERLEEALDCCNRCLQFDKDNTAVKSLREKTSQSKKAKDEKQKQREEKLRKERAEQAILVAAYQRRNLIIMRSPKGTADNVYQPKLDPNDATQQTVMFPVFFLYPQYATTDVIEEFQEDTAFAAHIATMFPPQAPPPDWDKQGEYIDGRLVVYAMTHQNRLLRVGKKMSLRDVFNASAAKPGEPKDGLELKDGCLTFVVLPRGKVETSWFLYQAYHSPTSAFLLFGVLIEVTTDEVNNHGDTTTNLELVYTPVERPASTVVSSLIADFGKPSAESTVFLDQYQGQIALHSPHIRRTVPQPKATIIISSAVGGVAVLINILLVVIFCINRRRRARRHPMYNIQPYTERWPVYTSSTIPQTPQTPYTAQPILDPYTPSPQRISRSRSFVYDISSAPATAHTAEGPNLPSLEVECFYQHSDGLTVQTGSLHAEEREELHQEPKLITRSERMQTAFAALRAEVERVKRRSTSDDQEHSGHKTTPSMDLMGMLHELEGLRTEVEGLLMQSERPVSLERLPSYSSRMTSKGYVSPEPPPPLPPFPIPLHIKC
ncbi:hypothetical protein EIP86_005669 [Pleurotus ostreatoroseus]|nr:hypothetical protein EIP86_005669 [Pleurotus ostreatoroseus]